MKNLPKYLVLMSLLFGIGLGLGIVLAFFRNRTEIATLTTQVVLPSPSPTPEVQILPPDHVGGSKLVSPPTPIPDQVGISPEGKKYLTLKASQNEDTTTKYSLWVSDSATQSGQMVYTETVNSPTTFSIPFNTWSPGNQYFYVQERTGTRVENLVFKANGNLFPDAKIYLNVNTIFDSKNLNVNLREVTGWAAQNLLIVNTDTPELQEGPSYWFNVSNSSFTKLSTRFQ